MFTGLITDIGKIQSITKSAKGQTFEIKTQYSISDLEIGESIAIDGVCLTATKFGARSFWVDASLETLSRTTLGDFKTGDQVHLERAMQLSGRLGGHLVLGHVDGVGSIQSRVQEGNALIYTFNAPPSISTYLLDKGSVGINGVSLTVNSLTKTGFTVAIIPHTQDKTNFSDYKIGRRVNLEADIIGKYVHKFLTGGKDRKGGLQTGLSGGIDLETLMNAGFSPE